MIDEKALELLGLNEQDFKPKEQSQEQRMTEMEKAMVALLGGDTE